MLRPLIRFDSLRISREDPAPASSAFRFVVNLAGGGTTDGTLCIERAQSNPFNEEETQLLTAIAEQIAAIVATHSLRKRQAQAELILKINNEIASNLELRPLLRSITRVLRSTLGCDFVIISVPDHDSGNMQAFALDFPGSRGVFQEGARLSIETSVVGQVYRTRRRRLVRDNRELDPILYARAEAEGITEACFCPLVHQDRALGVMTAGWREAGRFRDDVGEILDAVAIQVAIAVDNAMAYQKISELKDQLAQEKLYLEDEIRGEFNFSEIVGNSPALRRVLKQVETVAPTDSSVLIYGETGSGKELIARAIHDLSARRSGTFVKLNCAAIPTGLLESELFGHEKGAFTGAVAQRIGRFELANRGTIFLDEIGEVPLELQPKLLRVLQEREFERLGSSRTLRSDARLIAATNRDLNAMVEKQAFRADLYYRLNVFPIHVPPLRERPEDVPLLVRHFAHQFARRMNRTIDSVPAETMNALQRYLWPGNIRELQNLIERAVILSSGSVLQVPVEELKARVAPPRVNETSQTLADAERAHILAVLKETNWVLAGANGAAARLGMNRSTLRFRMSKLGIERPSLSSQ
ncbi:MAG TPA: sigma 54-interacting transcriptional regulator [Bryobacteraceae bacterium]|nr:sigma 54-interacting transcriptional regulator [Bryobacteraceae bacterium]